MGTQRWLISLPVMVCLGGAGPAAAQAPEEIGAWGPVQSSPVVAVHSSLLPSGKVLLWPQFDSLGRNGTEAYLWDPLLGFQSAVNNTTELYCSGHASLADGRLLSIGGEVAFATGLRSTNVFDSASEAWSQRALMNFGRWYPTATTLADGRVLATSGLINLDSVATTPEVYEVNRDEWTPLPAADLSLPLYPFIFVLPDGQIFYAGPGIFTATLDLNTETWKIVSVSNVLGDSAAMYLPGKVLKSGGGNPPLNGADVIDMTEVAPVWQAVGPMALARRSHNLVLLADGKVLAVGGTSAGSVVGEDPSNSVLEAELWDPNTGTWATMAPIGDPRMYHSTAVLLPDGRVFVAGGNDFPSYQVYSPPYLFQGARPSVTAAPGSVLVGLTFTVETPDAASIASVSLMRPSSVTHGFDQNQRYVPLDFTVGSGELEITAPPDTNVAPPGVYMLFLVNQTGVPSIAEFVLLTACDEDGVCEAGENCHLCPGECISGDGASCGNGICETGNAEDCVSCPLDCSGKQSGKLSKQFCCGNGGGQNPVDCADPRCTSRGFDCSQTPAVTSCCGNFVCEDIENGSNCEVDCGAPSFCGDGPCDSGEDVCSCAVDCGAPPSTETECTDGDDNDCDGDYDCEDLDCTDDPDCQCQLLGTTCTSDDECCSNRCKGKRGARVCK